MRSHAAETGGGVGAILPLRQVFELGRIWYAGRTELAWSRRSPEETRRVFDRMGLGGEFWSP